jgi:hypothetical protein
MVYFLLLLFSTHQSQQVTQYKWPLLADLSSGRSFLICKIWKLDEISKTDALTSGSIISPTQSHLIKDRLVCGSPCWGHGPCLLHQMEGPFSSWTGRASLLGLLIWLIASCLFANKVLASRYLAPNWKPAYVVCFGALGGSKQLS